MHENSLSRHRKTLRKIITAHNILQQLLVIKLTGQSRSSRFMPT